MWCNTGKHDMTIRYSSSVVVVSCDLTSGYTMVPDWAYITSLILLPGNG